MRKLSGALGVLAGLLLVSPALAGGWAITTLDSLPPGLTAGETYRVGYTILQHGVTPVRDARPAIQISAGAERQTFAGRAEGAPGHYVSEVVFPSSGEWTWIVDQSPFEPQALGTVSISPAPAVPEPVDVPRPVLQPVLGLLSAAALLVVLVGWRPLARRLR